MRETARTVITSIRSTTATLLKTFLAIMRIVRECSLYLLLTQKGSKIGT